VSRAKIGSAAWAKEKNRREGKARPKRKPKGGFVVGAKASGTAKATTKKGSGSDLLDALTGVGTEVAEVAGIPGAVRAVKDPVIGKVEAVAKADSIGEVLDAIQKPTNQDLSDQADLAMLVLPGAAAVKGTKVATKAIKLGSEGRKVEKIAKTSKAAKDAEKAAQKAAKGGKAESKVNRLERRAAKSKVKARRAKMDRRARTRDRAKAARTRAQEKAYTTAYKAAVGTGGAGGAAAAGREALKKEPQTKIRAATGLLGQAAKAPGKAAGGVSRAALAPAAAPVTAAIPAENKAQRLASAPIEVAKATAEDPLTVGQQSLIAMRDMLLGAPAALKQTVTDPVGAGEMLIEDYKRRYGPLLEGDTELFRERIKTEGGITPFALDALIVVPPAGKVGGSLAKSGALGKKAKDFMLDERPALKVEVGSEAVPQKLSGNAAGVAAQRMVDKRRARSTKRRAGDEDAPGNAQARAAMDADAVVPIRQKSATKKAVAATKARGRQMLLSQQSRVLRVASKLIRSMSKDQQAALKWALTLGIRDAETARIQLTKRIEAIQEGRAGTVYGKQMDNIPELEQIIANADEIFTPEFNESIGILRRVEKRLAVVDPLKETGRRDPALDPEQAALRRVAQQAEHLGIERKGGGPEVDFDAQAMEAALARSRGEEPGVAPAKVEGESNAEYIARVREAAKEAGLDEAGYFPSELSRRRKFSQSAVGGTRHSERTKRYGGELFRQGIENTDPNVLIRGLQRNVKRRINWNMVSDIFARNGFDWSKAPDGNGKTMAELIQEMGRRGVNEDSVVFVNPGLLRRIASDEFTVEPGRVAAEINDTNFTDLGEAIRDSTQLRATAQFDDMKGWYAVPKEVMDELESSMKVGPAGRAADVLMSKMSGYMLALNTGWLGFQTISTAAQAAMAGVGPLAWVQAQIFFHRLAKEQRAGRRPLLDNAVNSRQVVGTDDLDILGAYTGTAQAHALRSMPQMGAATKNWPNWTQGAVEGYRIYKEGRWGQAMASANPIALFFRAAQFPESAQRKALAYKLLKTEQGKRISANMKRTDAAITRLTNAMSVDPQGQVRALIKERGALEEMAQGLADFLGDYQTFTAAERTYLKRMLPFYSWTRFATKFAFYTLPKKHPVTVGLIYQLGRLETKELRDILGDDMGWALGKMFFGDPADPDSTLIDMYRGNPVMSALTEVERVKDLMGFLPPYVPVLMNQIYSRDYFTNQDLTVNGETSGRRFVDRSLLDSAQIMFNDLAGIFTPYRVAAEIQYAGTPMTDDSIPFIAENPKNYAPGRGSDTKAREEQEFVEDGGAAGVLKRRMLPFVPMPSNRLRETADYISAEADAERARLRESTGGPATTTDLMDDLRSSMQSQSAVNELMDELRKSMEQ
jgi:hypothetical protein